MRIGILISGGGSNMVALVEAMQREKFATAACVISNRPGAGGMARAEALGVPATCVDHTEFADRSAFEDALNDVLLRHDVDVICLAGFMRVLTEGFVRRWQDRMLNIHPSLLPKYKGLHTHARAIEAGDTEAGCTVHLVTPELDDGPILGQARVPVMSNDTADTLAARILPMEHALYPAVLQRFVEQGRDAGLLELSSQPDSGLSL